MNSRKRLLSSDHPSHSVTDALPCCFGALELGLLDPKASSLKGAGCGGHRGRVGSIPQLRGSQDFCRAGVVGLELASSQGARGPFPSPLALTAQGKPRLEPSTHRDNVCTLSHPTPTGESPQESKEKGRQHLVGRCVGHFDQWVGRTLGPPGRRVTVRSSWAGRESRGTPFAPRHASSPPLGQPPLHLGLWLLRLLAGAT